MRPEPAADIYKNGRIKTTKELDEAQLRKAWVKALDAPNHTYDWDCHPEDYDEPCACTECREASV